MILEPGSPSVHWACIQKSPLSIAVSGDISETAHEINIIKQKFSQNIFGQKSQLSL